MRKLKIAFYCTNEFSCPLPEEILYAPMDLAERIVLGLAGRGHDVTFYCSYDSKIKAKKESGEMVSYYKSEDKISNGGFHDQGQLAVYEQLLASKMYEDSQGGKYDIIHAFHLVPKILPFVNLTKTPTVFTLHDPMDAKWNNVIKYCRWKNRAHYVSISDSQRRGMPDLNYAATVYNGIDPEKSDYNEKPEDYFAFLGRYAYEKGADIAVKVAVEAGEKLRMAGTRWGDGFYNEKIKPFLKKDRIEDVGFLEKEKVSEFLRNAKALLFPVRWQEPFGLVMIEAMACGTPVIAFDNGSVSEVVSHGKTGFIVKNEAEMAEAIKSINKINRRECRARVEKYFTTDRMVDGYENVYEKIINAKR